MTAGDHRRLAEVLHQVKGMVVLSGYPCRLYDQDLYAGWRRETRAHLADGARERTEVVWLNPACGAALKAGRAQSVLDLPVSRTPTASTDRSPGAGDMAGSMPGPGKETSQ